MKFEVQYHAEVVLKDIPSLPKNDRGIIKKAIESRLVNKPDQHGKPLRRSLKGYRKLRVGDYRVVFRIEGNVVKIFIIQNRKVVYENVEKRLG